MITNPTPIQAATFSGMWITSISVMTPRDGKRGMLRARFLPYDGDKHLLAIGTVDLVRPIPHAETDAIVASIVTEVKRQAKTDKEVRVIHVNAPDPSKPVTATVMFAEGSPHFIKDCFALVATDATFAGVFGTAMANIAGLAVFEVE